MPGVIKYTKPIIFILFSFIPVLAQSGIDRFISTSGNFRIDYLGSPLSEKEIAFDQGIIFGQGTQYFWDKPGEYNFNIFFYTIASSGVNLALPPSGKPIMSAADKAKFLAPMRKELAEASQKCGCALSEKPYTLNGSSGTELRLTSSRFESVTRVVFIKDRFFYIQAFFNSKADRLKVFNALESFAVLNFAEVLKAKLLEAEPKPLPQEPAAPKAKTDAQDENLKGRVKGVIEEYQEAPGKIRERTSEKYFNEAGNFTRDVDYIEGYPQSISVWGYLDGYRVVNSNSMYFDEDQRPPPRHQILSETAAADPSKPRDPRYTSRHVVNYDDFGHMAEKFIYGSNGSVWTHIVYSYSGDRMIETDYYQDGAMSSSTGNTLDKNGNVIEDYPIEKSGKPTYFSIYKYEFDDKGNWIVKRSYDKKTVKGKSVLKLESTTYRTITYYP